MSAHTAPALEELPLAPAAPVGSNGHGPDSAPRRGGVLGSLTSWMDLRRSGAGLMPVLVLSFLGFFQTFDDQFFTIAAPNIVRDLHASVESVAGTFEVLAIVTLVASLVVAFIADKRPRVPMAWIGSIVSGIAAMLLTRGTSPVTVTVPKAVDTAVSNSTSNPMQSLLADYYEPGFRARVFALFTNLQLLAAIAAPALCGVLITTYGWRTAGVVVAIPMIVMGILAALLLREPIRGYFERRALGLGEEAARLEDVRPSVGEAWRTVWAVRTLRRLFIGDVFLLGGTVVYTYLFTFFLANEYGLDATQRGLFAIPTVLVTLVVGVLVSGPLDELGRRAPQRVLLIVGISTVVSGLALFIIGAGVPLPVLVGATVFFTAGVAAGGPGKQAVLTQVIPPTVRTSGLQLVALAGIPGSLIFVPLAGTLLSQYGFSVPFEFLVAPMFLIGALIQLTAAGLFETDRRNALLSAGAGDEYRLTLADRRGKLLVCRGVDVAYDGNQVLFGVDLDVDEGEIIALLGTNGAGKSTLLRAISGTQEASAGAILVGGRDVTHMPPHEIAALGVVHMPGGRGVFPGLTVRENLQLGTWMAATSSEATAGLERVYQLFPVLRERGGEQAGSLSGGEQQMLSLGQAFLAKPRLLMIDELSLGLSPAMVGQLLEAVSAIHARGTTVIVVEQSVNVALTIASRAVFMEKGEVEFVGATADLMRRPDILRAVYVKGTGALGGGSVALPGARERREQELAEARPVLDVVGVTKRFGGVQAVDGVSLTLRQGEVLGLIGPNGSGKTTLFDLIGGSQVPDSGRILLDGVDVTGLAVHERARRKLVRRFQDARLFPSLTVLETLLVALDQRLEVRSALLSAAAMPQARRAERRARARADRLIELLELGAHRDKFVRELSTGLRRIVDLACVLAREPKVLLLDEPSSGIAQAEAEGLAPLLRRVRFESGCSLLLIEHDMPLICAVADELVALDRGSILVRGRAEEVLADQRVVDAYLGGSEAAVRRSGSLA